MGDILTLRDYQHSRMIDPAIKAFREGHKAVLIVGSTGCGKSSVIAWWAARCQEAGRRVLTICHKQLIQGQLLDTFKKFGVEADEISAGKKITNNKIQIARIQSLKNKLASVPVPDWIIGDEFHHFRIDNMWGEAVSYFKEKNPNIKIMGVTATPNGRIDGLGLHPFATHMVSELTTRQLVDDGWLVYPHTMIGEKLKIPEFHIDSTGDYSKEEQKDYFGSNKIIGSAVENYHQFLDGKPTIVSCVSLDHAYYVQQQYERAAKDKGKDWKFVMIQGGKKYEKQMFDAIAGLSSGSVQGLTFVDVLGEGVDVPSCVAIQFMRKMMSYVLYKQFGGRTLRPLWPSWFDQYKSTREERLSIIRDSIKPQAEIQDFAGNCEQHGHLLDDPLWTLQDTRITGKKGDQLKMPSVSICPACTGVWSGHPDTCPDCGYNLKDERDRKEGRRPPKEIEGILREVMPTGRDIQALRDRALSIQALSPAEKQKTLIRELYRQGVNQEVRALAMAMGYSKYWPETMARRLKIKRNPS